VRRFEIRIKRETDMGLIETASANSIWRGMDYYEARKVISWEKTGTFAYDGIVSGSEGNKYTVHIETNHPRRSTCNCPFADGRRVVCKHMIALYFTAEPKAAESFLKQVEEWDAEEQEREKQHYEELRKYVNQLSKAELRERLYDALVELEKRDNYWR
jgi:hypothetical protein